MDADWARREALLRRAEEVVIETRERLLNEGVHPLLVIHALFYSGLGPVAIKHLNVEDKLAVCGMLQDYINDTKEVIIECRN